jgi:hypothetical protein
VPRTWIERMKRDPTRWLLTHDDPMVRYRALTWIEERSEHDPEVQAARRAAALHPRLETLLAGQHAEGWWENPDHFATDYYYGTAWRLYLAAQLGAERTPEIARGVEFLFEVSQSRDGGGFSHAGSRRRGGTLNGQWACLTGAMLETLIHFGYASDFRTRRALAFIMNRQQPDGLFPCENFTPNRSTLPLNCYVGSVKPLAAMLSLPEHLRTPHHRLFAERTAETLLGYTLYQYKRAPGGRPTAKPEWLRLGFPRFWNTDILEVSWILARLGYTGHPALERALGVILGKQLSNGRWPLEFDYNDRMPIALGKRGVGNPWITLRALHTLRLSSAPRLAAV